MIVMQAYPLYISYFPVQVNFTRNSTIQTGVQIINKGEKMKDGKNEIKIKFQEQIIGGKYANALHISHTGEEFIMDFLLVSPPTGTVNSRIITSPGHMKRIISAIQENIKKYE